MLFLEANKANIIYKNQKYGEIMEFLATSEVCKGRIYPAGGRKYVL